MMFPIDHEYVESNIAQQVHQYPDLEKKEFMDHENKLHILHMSADCRMMCL
jgi:hypothetical protein